MIVRKSDGIDPCARFVSATRAVWWYDENLNGIAEAADYESYFENCEWYIVRSKELSFAAKCGNNGESHNHNDIGGFIITVDGEQIITDYGSGEYMREYFRDETRYDFLVTSSRGHSVPIIDREYQKSGSEFRGKVLKHSDAVFRVDFAEAYGLDYLSSAKRSFKVNDDFIEMTDKFEFSDSLNHRITERFISLVMPRIKGGLIQIGSVLLLCDKTAHISEERVSAHSGKCMDTIYFIDYESDKEFKIKFKKQK